MRIGIDLGGTKIEGIALAKDRCDDAADDTILARRRIRTPRDDYAATVESVASLVRDLEAEVSASGTVGIAIPGTISPATDLVKNANSTWMIGQPFHRDIERALGREVRVRNDANCFALSEAVDGAGAGYEVVFGVILGTGCGGGVVVRRTLLNGPNAIAGEWGHNSLPWPREDERPGPACYCGRHGCIETFISGTGLARDHARATGDKLDAKTIAARAAEGDSAACETLARYDHRLARALASIINILDPSVIVLGGGLSNMTHLYQRIPELWDEFVFSDRVDTPLLPPRHGDSSGVRGAAWLWSDAPP